MDICGVNGVECCECQPVCGSKRKDGDFEDEVLYGISIDGAKPMLWYESYPTQNQIKFASAGDFESVNVIEKIITYCNVAMAK